MQIAWLPHRRNTADEALTTLPGFQWLDLLEEQLLAAYDDCPETGVNIALHGHSFHTGFLPRCVTGNITCVIQNSKVKRERARLKMQGKGKRELVSVSGAEL